MTVPSLSVANGARRSARSPTWHSTNISALDTLRTRSARMFAKALTLSLVAVVLVLPISSESQAGERFLLEILPLEIVWDASDGMACVTDCSDTMRYPPDTALPEAMNLVRSAMGLLGVREHEYDLVLSEHEPQRLACRMPSALEWGMSCQHETLGAFDSWDSIKDMMLKFGHSRKKGAHRGTAILGVLLLPDGFVWARSLYGVNKWWSWNGWEPEDLHWTTTSCAIWSAPWLSTLAHEIGHCFGLWHADDPANDKNYDGMDNSVDLMGGSHLMTFNLRPSNAARVRHHFRVLTETEVEQISNLPFSEGVGRIVID